jgi:hypothetical protein
MERVKMGDEGSGEVGVVGVVEVYTYQDGRVPVVHHVVAEAGAGACHPAPAEALVEACDSIREMHP